MALPESPLIVPIGRSLHLTLEQAICRQVDAAIDALVAGGNRLLVGNLHDRSSGFEDRELDPENGRIQDLAFGKSRPSADSVPLALALRLPLRCLGLNPSTHSEL
jgi:hypothetical protein